MRGRFPLRLDPRLDDLDDGRLLGFIQLGGFVLFHEHVVQGLLI